MTKKKKKTDREQFAEWLERWEKNIRGEKQDSSKQKEAKQP